ncbi:PTS system, mannose-specific IID component [Clostridium cavendishii DSM 21758]|uniref:PTS system, mannose-specific IID component n=1 Tax=Clostridium cavendishii DSM 21758 TaxID=1121302 RepID=A0A1M6URT8_9CLOT|nr:PTS system mannose/fructose/sorbose family transporter subunit IID [Clostridium cavendishii]SHK71925.1 PTS system, mannose-specific IID component [Clostridium cavendishii DSM 21758]
MKMNNNNVENKVVDKKLLRRVTLRWWAGVSCGWNYEKMQALGLCYALMPALKKIHTNTEDLKKSVKNHLQFFNTNQGIGGIIVGATLALEEDKSQDNTEAIAAVKTGLMGPLAGIGDTVFGAIPKAVIGAIAANMAIQGNPIGILFWFAFDLFLIYLTFFFVRYGYEKGTSIVGEAGSKLKNLTEVANVLGVTVVGALIPTFVNTKMIGIWSYGKVSLNAQKDIMDKIMPGLVPAAIVALTYWLLGKKGMNSTRVLLLIVVFGFLGAYIQLFGI